MKSKLDVQPVMARLGYQEWKRSKGLADCPTRWFIKSLEEIGPDCDGDWFAENAGKEVLEYLGGAATLPDHKLFYYDGRLIAIELLGVKQVTEHSFVQTGAQRSWCSQCDCNGRFDFQSGKYQPE